MIPTDNCPLATVIIPNWNGMRWLPKCIEALKRQTVSCFEILVVENASTDGSLAWLQEHGVPYLKNDRNLGFAGGVNAGIRSVLARGAEKSCETDQARKTVPPYVILLNNDTEAEPGFVEALLKSIEKDRKLFAVSAMMLRVQDTSTIDDAGDSMTLPGWAFQRGTEEPRSRYEQGCEVFSACGGAAIYRTEYLEKTGLFDETHFAYLEDLDLCWRARLMGYRNRYCPEARVKHYGSATSGSKYNAFKVRLSSRNHIWLMYKNQPDFLLILHGPWIAAGLLVKALFFAKKGLFLPWLSGTWEGLTHLERVRRVDFSRVPPHRLLSIERLLILGTLEYVRHYAERALA
ncbi:MAG: glycosyltransferase family 2 protein [Stomatobaculum sp.]|nr:glycosyltransferase family 2 protein [Stomatobaculum sp.]